MMKQVLERNWPWFASFVLLSLAFPPLNVFLLVFVALVPWLRVLRDGDGKKGFWAGYGFGFFYFLFQMFWLMPFVGKWTGSYGMAALPWLVCGILAGVFYGVTGWLMAQAFALRVGFLVPLIWAGSEAVRAYVPGLAFPWGIAALPLWQIPVLAQAGAWGTIFLVSAWVVLVNLIVLEVFFPKESGVEKRLVRWYGIAAVGLAVLSAFRYSNMPSGEEKTFTLGQPGVDMAFLTPDEERQALLNATGDLVLGAELQNSDLLILPEGYAGRVYDLPQTPLGLEPTVNVIMGGQREAEDGRVFQTAYAWDGAEWSHADKTRLVVFGEYVPLRDQLPFLRNFNLPAGDLVEGDTLITMDVAGMKVGPLICFEGVFPDLAVGHSTQGAQVLVQMSIDDWYEATPAHDQLWMSTIWRSIESGLPILRVGGRGKSLATDARGNVLVDVPVGKRIPAMAKVVVPEGSDAFDGRFWFVWLSWVVCAGVGVFGSLRRTPE